MFSTNILDKYSNVALMREIGNAAKTEDFQAAGESLMKLAQGMISIQNYSPNRGSQASWDSTFEAFINAAFRGIGACGARDIDGLNTALRELGSLNKEGHRAHK